VHGGTTCTIVCVIRTETKWRIVCSNVGDSDALLLARKPSRLQRDNNKCKHLSVDHSPDNADEFLRIKNLSTDKYPTKLLFVYDQANTCRKFECPIVFLEDGTKDPKYVKNPWGNQLRPTNVRYDPAVYAVSPYGVSHDITCIAMTRSLGDFYAHQFGLTNKPSVTFNDLDMFQNDSNEACEYIITVGSDGVWDCWKWDDFSDYVNGVMTKFQNKLENVCKTVLKHTIQRAKACFGEGSYDDASLVCVALRPQLFSPSEHSTTDNDNDANAAADANHGNASTVNGHVSSSNHANNSNPAHHNDDNEEKEELSLRGLDEDDD
jgi:serine/threonine protein phosphatase PrpC